MGENTAIEWAHHTFNPWWGCEKVSAACTHCYAETFSNRLGKKLWGPGSERRFFSDKHWNEPRKWDRSAAKRGVRERVFCASMADVLEERSDLDGPRYRLCRLIEETPNLDWMLLTKRPENAPILSSAWFDGHWPANCWFGVTAESQEMADLRIPIALRVPAPIHFVSMEPLLGPVNLRALRDDTDEDCLALYFPLAGEGICDGMNEPRRLSHGGIDLVIVGGESGHGARPTHPDWARSLRDQCAEAGVAFHFKQWGEWAPCRAAGIYEGVSRVDYNDGAAMLRLGKKQAGRELDGRTWDEMPRGAAPPLTQPEETP